MIGPIFEDEDPDKLTPDEAIERFSLSAKNPRHIVSENGWDYMTAVGPYGGYSCPVYKYPARTDRYLIFSVSLPSRDHKPIHWILRGVALLCTTA